MDDRTTESLRLLIAISWETRNMQKAMDELQKRVTDLNNYLVTQAIGGIEEDEGEFEEDENEGNEEPSYLPLHKKH
jgi:hypothetical protein